MSSSFAMERRSEAAFTLIELLVVVIIIGILAAIAVPHYVEQRTRARETAAIAALRSAAGYMELTQATDQAYPSTVPPLVAQGFRAGEMVIEDADISVSGNDYAIRGVHAAESGVVACFRSTVGNPLLISAVDSCAP